MPKRKTEIELVSLDGKGRIAYPEETATSLSHKLRTGEIKVPAGDYLVVDVLKAVRARAVNTVVVEHIDVPAAKLEAAPESFNTTIVDDRTEHDIPFGQDPNEDYP